MEYESEDHSTIDGCDCESSIHSDFEYIQSDSLISEDRDDEDQQTILPARCSSFAPSILKRSLHDEMSSSQYTVPDYTESILNLEQVHQLNVLKDSLKETAEQVMILLTDRMKQKELVNDLRNKVHRLEVKNERLKANVERKRKSIVKELKPTLSLESTEEVLDITTSEEETTPHGTWKKFIYIFVILLVAVIIAMQLQVRKLDAHNVLLKAEVNKLTHKLTRYETIEMTYQKGDSTIEVKKCQSLSEQNEKVSMENITLRQENTVLATIIIIIVLALLFKLFFTSILDALRMIEKRV